MRLKHLALFIVPLCALVLLNGCSSGSDVKLIDLNKTHGFKAKDGATFGSGPNNTKPYPQDEPVNLNNVKGAAIRYEKPSRGGNKNYTVLGKNYQVWNGLDSYQEIGIASWYGPGFHGNKTSNGEVYNQKGFSAAHKNLPLPSYLKVTNLDNGKAVIVRVNDRGPFHGSRIIDLSEGAAKAINMTGKGTAKVKLEYIKVLPGNIVANRVGSNISGQGASTGADSIKTVVSDLKNGNTPSTATIIAATATVVKTVHDINEKYGDKEPNTKAKSQNVATSTVKTSSYETNTTKPTLSSVSANSNTVSYTNTNSTALNESQSKANDIESELFAKSSGASGSSAVSNSKTVVSNQYVQLFSTVSESKALDVKQSVGPSFVYPVVIVSEEGLYRVRIGPVPQNDLSVVLNQVKKLGYQDSFVKSI